MPPSERSLLLRTYADADAQRRRVDEPRQQGPRQLSPRQERPRQLSPRDKDPLWAKVALVLGALVMVASGTVVVLPKVLAAWATAGIPNGDLIPDEVAGENIDGAINFLLLGMDQRTGEEAEGAIRADTLIIVHIPAAHDKVFMISLPRDLEVAIPDYAPTRFKGFRTKINAAFAAGARKDGQPDPTPEGRQRGAQLTMLTINNLVPGGLKFNGAAIINFDGFKDVLEALGGVELCVDEETRSIHFDKSDKYHYAEVPYNSRKIYKPGCQPLEAWEALDFARQRHFDNGDYTRQRHQQQLLLAILKKVASRGTLTDLGLLRQLQSSAGELLTLDLGKAAAEDWAFTLKSLGADDVVMIKTNGGKVTPVGNGNERLTEESQELLKAVHDDTVFDFLTKHSDWIVQDQDQPAPSAS